MQPDLLRSARAGFLQALPFLLVLVPFSLLFIAVIAIIGGWLADRLLGNRVAVIAGAALMTHEVAAELKVRRKQRERVRNVLAYAVLIVALPRVLPRNPAPSAARPAVPGRYAASLRRRIYRLLAVRCATPWWDITGSHPPSG